jgi:sugar phosphate isomerase/epimerase
LNSTRRNLLRLGALALPGSAFAALAPIRRHGGSHLRIALNAFSFLELLNANRADGTKGIDLFGVCDYCAEQGIDAVDLTGYFFPAYPAAPPRDYLIRLKRHILDLGLDISGTGVRNDFTAATEATRAEGVARVKAWIEVAATLGAPVIRAFADSQPPYKNWREAAGTADRGKVEGWVADALRECAVHGEKFGVVVGVQNHGDFINTGAEHLSLLDRVGHGWCGALVDTGKYFTADPYADIALTAPHAVNWQVKETLDSTLASPHLDMPKLVGIIRRSGYRGYLPIETLAMGRKDYDPRAEVRKMVTDLRKALANTSV